MDKLERLWASEAIRKKKATYWYAMDMKKWDMLSEVFMEDAVVDYRGARDFTHKPVIESAEAAIAAGHPAVIKGRDAIVDWIRRNVSNWTTVHHGHAPIIDVMIPETPREFGRYSIL